MFLGMLKLPNIEGTESGFYFGKILAVECASFNEVIIAKANLRLIRYIAF
jgi:hypothetical protein